LIVAPRRRERSINVHSEGERFRTTLCSVDVLFILKILFSGGPSLDASTTESSKSVFLKFLGVP